MSFKVRLYTIEKYDRSTKQPTGTGKEYECLLLYVYFNKGFKICLENRCCWSVLPVVDVLLGNGLRKGLAWGTLPRDRAWEHR